MSVGDSGAANMNESDYRELINLLTVGIRAIGIPGLSDQALFADSDTETREFRTPNPRDRLVHLLTALDQFLASDHETYARALRNINKTLENPGVSAVAVRPRDERLDPLDLQEMLDKSGIRSRLKELIQRIKDDPDPGPGSDSTPRTGPGPSTGPQEGPDAVPEADLNGENEQVTESNFGLKL